MDLDDKWTTLQALAIYGEHVRPKTLTMYDDAMRLSCEKYAQYNLYILMCFMFGQVIKDMYTTVLNAEGPGRFPTEREYVEHLFDHLLENYADADSRKSAVDNLLAGNTQK